ncbi:MAG: D-glycero-alpha-D-manno-heptose-1,7-bisphosphate 7-phosphatase [Gemmatimonas sp.]
MARGRPAVFLDRDGVVVRGLIRGGKSYAPRCLAEFRLLPGAAGAVRKLHRRGFRVVIVTNQPDIGNGIIDRAVVEAMHERLRRAMPIDAIEICPHRQTDGCSCRKPKAGMLRAAARRSGIDLHRSIMVGDRPSDVVAGAKAGCYTIFVDRRLERCVEVKPNKTVRSLPEASRHILASSLWR